MFEDEMCEVSTADGEVADPVWECVRGRAGVLYGPQPTQRGLPRHSEAEYGGYAFGPETFPQTLLRHTSAPGPATAVFSSVIMFTVAIL